MQALKKCDEIIGHFSADNFFLALSKDVLAGESSGDSSIFAFALKARHFQSLRQILKSKPKNPRTNVEDNKGMQLNHKHLKIKSRHVTGVHNTKSCKKNCMVKYGFQTRYDDITLSDIFMECVVEYAENNDLKLDIFDTKIYHQLKLSQGNFFEGYFEN